MLIFYACRQMLLNVLMKAEEEQGMRSRIDLT